MAKAPVTPVTNLQNEQTAVGRINQNDQTLSTTIEDQLSRSGTAPNEMLANLDMNNNRVLNLPFPETPTEPARHGDLQQYVDRAEDAAEDAEQSAEDAADSADDALASAELAEDLLDEFQGQYLGASPTDPTEDTNGNPLQVGALYFNTSTAQFKAYSEPLVQVLDDTVMVLAEPVIIALWVVIPMTSLLSLDDVNPDNLAHQAILRWNAGTGFFELIQLDADKVGYDNTTSNLTADDVQEAVDELIERSFINSYDVTFFVQGRMGNNETVWSTIAVRPFFLPVNLADSLAICGLRPLAEVTFLIRKNGTQIGTLVFDETSDDGVFSFAGVATFNTGDVLTFHSPDPADTVFADVTVSLRAWRP